MSTHNKVNRVLTIAGSDSGGGAGIQADIKTITLLGGFGMSVVTALTAQNTQGVKAIHAPPASFVKAQLETVLSDLGADAVKTGMLYDASIIEVVAQGLQAYGIEKVVVDPVMVAKGGDRLLVESAVKALVERLVPLSYVLTPNVPEAEVLTQETIHSKKEIKRAAKKLYAMGASHVLIKGGHLSGPAEDTFFDGNRFEVFSRPRLETPHTHGTGCVFAAALATFLGAGLDVITALEKAKSFIHDAIRFAVPLGKGHGPTNLYASFARELARFRVLEALEAAAIRLTESSIGHLIPEVHSHFGYALPFARTVEDVAAFPGRLIRNGEKVVPVGGPRFGVSGHIAGVVLAVMEHDLTYRSAMHIRFSESRLKQCENLGWTVRSLAAEKSKNGKIGDLEWGIDSVLSRGKKIPDIICDGSALGKEPLIWVLGRSPQEVVEKVLQL